MNNFNNSFNSYLIGKYKKRLLFSNEYYAELFRIKNKKKYKIRFFKSFEELQKYNNSDQKFILKKLKKFRFLLTKKLNKIHSTNLSEDYWGIHIDFYLLFIIKIIKNELNLLNKIGNKSKIKKKTFNHNLKFLSFKDFHDSFNENNLVLESLKDHIWHYYKYNKKKEINNSSVVNKKFSYYHYFITNLKFNFFRVLFSFFKPTLIVGGYFGKWRSIKFLFKSYGRLFFLPEKVIFPYIQKNFQTNLEMRKMLIIKADDKFDKLFNLLNVMSLPGSIVENFKFFQTRYSLLSKKLKNFGTGGSFFENDGCKFIAGLQKNEKKKFFSFQHGSPFNNSKFSFFEEIEKKYCNERFLWNQSDGLGNNYLHQYRKLRKNLESKKNILFLPTKNYLYDPIYVNLAKKFHPSKNLNYEIFSGLSKKLKKITIIKLFPSKESIITKGIWMNRFGNSFKEIYFSNEKSITFFKKAKIVILDDISTAFYELVYLNIPFILVMENLDQFNAKLRSKLIKLKKLKILFSDSSKAASFLNKNSNNIDHWWSRQINKKNYKDIKKTLFNESKKNIDTLLINRLLKLKN